MRALLAGGAAIDGVNEVRPLPRRVGKRLTLTVVVDVGMFQCWTSVCGHVCQRDVGSWSIACAVGGWWLQRGRSALSEACYHSRSSVVKELLFRGAAFGLIDKVSSIGAGVHWSLCLRPVGGQDDSVSVHSPVVCIPS